MQVGYILIIWKWTKNYEILEMRKGLSMFFFSSFLWLFQSALWQVENFLLNDHSTTPEVSSNFKCA